MLACRQKPHGFLCRRLPLCKGNDLFLVVDGYADSTACCISGCCDIYPASLGTREGKGPASIDLCLPELEKFPDNVVQNLDPFEFRRLTGPLDAFTRWFADRFSLTVKYPGRHLVGAGRKISRVHLDDDRSDVGRNCLDLSSEHLTSGNAAHAYNQGGRIGQRPQAGKVSLDCYPSWLGNSLCPDQQLLDVFRFSLECCDLILVAGEDLERGKHALVDAHLVHDSFEVRRSQAGVSAEPQRDTRDHGPRVLVEYIP